MKRTETQNNSLHLYFRLLAEELNDSGQEMKIALPKIRQTDVPWTEETIKECLWRPIQDAQLRKKSTTQLTTSEVNKIYETLNRHLGERLGVHVPFPSIEPEMY